MVKLVLAVRRMLRPIRKAWRSRSNAAIFSRIYREKLWGSSPTLDQPFYSGAGSYDPAVSEYVAVIKKVIEEKDIRSIVEVGCGDFAVARQYVANCSSYIGFDIFKPLILYNNRNFGSESVSFQAIDASKKKLPASDACIIRQVLQHLSNSDISRILKNVSSRYLIVTEHLPAEAKITSYNLDMPAGSSIRVPRGSGVFLNMPPFNEPAVVIFERDVTSDIHEPDERLVTWLIDRKI